MINRLNPRPGKSKIEMEVSFRFTFENGAQPTEDETAIMGHVLELQERVKNGGLVLPAAHVQAELPPDVSIDEIKQRVVLQAVGQHGDIETAAHAIGMPAHAVRRILRDASRPKTPEGALAPVGSIQEARDAAERASLIAALERCSGNISRVALDLGISRPTAHGLLDKHALDANEYKVPGKFRTSAPEKEEAL